MVALKTRAYVSIRENRGVCKMEIDEIAQKRLNKFIENCLQENLHNRNSEVKTFASGAYHGI